MPEDQERPAFYALAPGGWRDYWTLLHPPYTLWHLSYVAIGGSVASTVSARRLGATLLAFLLAVGLAAHALDELRGRPLATSIPDGVLWAIAVLGLLGAVGIGVEGAIEVSPWLVVLIVAGVFLVVGYNLELFGGAFHSDLWFALGWGGFPAITGYFAQTGRISVASGVVAAGCVGLSAAQRALSTPVRHLRRKVRAVEGRLTFTDGGTEEIDAASLRQAPEAALRWMSAAIVALAVGLTLARLGV